MVILVNDLFAGGKKVTTEEKEFSHRCAQKKVQPSKGSQGQINTNYRPKDSRQNESFGLAFRRESFGQVWLYN